MNRQRLLITSGPTREYLDPVRYLSNGSSGRMGSCLADAAINAGFDVTIVSGPVHVAYPSSANVVNVVSTAEMLEQVMKIWPDCDGLIAAAAPSDFRPKKQSSAKLKKSDNKHGFSIELVENPDILAAAGHSKNKSQFSIGFALETENGIENARRKLAKKNCDYIVLNDPSAIDSNRNQVTVISQSNEIVAKWSGSKSVIAEKIIGLITGLSVSTDETG